MRPLVRGGHPLTLLHAPMDRSYWLMKSEPDEASIDTLAQSVSQCLPWTGVRNYLARNTLRKMHCGDLVLFYHSLTDKAIMGSARVTREAYPDPTSTDD